MTTGDILIALLRMSLFGVCFWAFLRGGGPERSGALLLIGAYTGQQLLAIGGFPITFETASYIHLSFTIILLLGSLALVVQSNRLWPLFFSAFTLVQVTGHLSVVLLEEGRSMAYWIMTQVPVIMQALILGIGALAHVRRRARGMFVADWRAKVAA